MQKTVNTTLVQRSKVRGEAYAFEIHDKHYLRVSAHTLLGSKRYHLHLAVLEPWPRRHRRVAWRWLAATLGFGAASAGILLVLMKHAEAAGTGLLASLLALSAVACLAALLMFLYRSPNVAEFHSRHGNCVLVSLMHRRPDRKSYEAFIAELTERILAASGAMRLSRAQILAAELKTLRRLTGESVLREADYAAAKRRIFELHDTTTAPSPAG